MCVGDVSLDDPNLSDHLAMLRRTALELEKGGVTTKLVIPNSQILYTEVHAPGPDVNAQIVQIREGLDGKTPYDVNDLVFDWRSHGQSAQVAVVLRDSLNEAESFAIQHGFNPVSFVSIPEFGTFDGEPFFGATGHAASLLGHGEEVEPDPNPMIILGTDQPHWKVKADGVRQRRESAATVHQSHQTPLSAHGPRRSPTEMTPHIGQSAPVAVKPQMPMTDSQKAIRLPLRGDQGLTRMPVTSPRIAGSGDTPGQDGTAGSNAGRNARLRSSALPSGGQSTQTDRYRKLGPPSSVAGIQGERTIFASHHPTRVGRLPRLAIVLLTLLLVIGICVGMLFWISPGPIETGSTQFQDSRNSSQTADGNPASTLENDEVVQPPTTDRIVEEPTGTPSTQSVRTLAAGWASDTVSSFPDVSENPPPDRILVPPPSIAESERIYVETGIWPLDPVQPVGMVGYGRIGDIYVANMDRVASPASATTGPEGSFETAGANLTLARGSGQPEDNGSYRQDLVDGLSTEVSGDGSDAPNRVSSQVTVNVQEAPDSPTELQPAVEHSAISEALQGIPALLDQEQLQLSTASFSGDASDESPEEGSNLAVAVSPLPVTRPEGLHLVANHRAVSEVKDRVGATAQHTSFASQATQRNAIDLGKINLIGTYGPTGERYALVRLSSSQIIKDIKIGDWIDGGRVTAIGASELHYVRNGQSITLRLPAG